MVENHYSAPFVITSLTGSLLWTLNYAHWLVRKGYGNVLIVLDSRMIAEDRIYPAPFLAAFLEVAPLKIHWHDDPYHEYLTLGDVPDNAILGSVRVNRQSLTRPDINTLLPGFSQVYPPEGLHASLDRFMTIHQNAIFEMQAVLPM